MILKAILKHLRFLVPLLGLSVNQTLASPSLYNWVNSPKEESLRVEEAGARLRAAITQPELLKNNWIELPTSPDVANKKLYPLGLREAILLALRYNPNIQNAELDRIMQRYQLRLAMNEFELHYALGASGVVQKSRFSGVGQDTTNTVVGTPELSLKTKLGTSASLIMNNNASIYNSYNPTLNANITQPLLRGFGFKVNETALLNAKDQDKMNQLNLKQSVIDQVTQVIMAYRTLILSANNFKNQRLQLDEAKNLLEISKKKIHAGQLEPTGTIQPAYQIESLGLMVEQAENDFNLASQGLLQAIGLDPAMRLSVPSDVELGVIKIPNLQQSIDLALVHNTQYLAQKVVLEVDERAYVVAKNQQLWQLDASANVQSGTASDVVGINNSGLKGIYSGTDVTQSARLTLTIPLDDLNRKSQLINAKLRLEKDRINLVSARRALVTHLTNTHYNIKSLSKRYQLAQKQVELAQQSYALEKKKQQAGIATALDVNNTQNQLIQAQAGLIGAKIAYLNQLSILQRTLGTTLDDWQIKLRYGG